MSGTPSPSKEAFGKEAEAKKSRPTLWDPAAFSPQLSQHTPLSYTLEDDLSTISISRQLESYFSPLMNESSDLFTLQSSYIPLVIKKMELLHENENETNEGDETSGNDGWSEDYDFWISYIQDPNDKIVRNRHVKVLENHICHGIPSSLRAAIYLKTLQVRYKFNKESYASLLKKANNSLTVRNQQAYFENLTTVDLSLKDILKIFNYYNAEVKSVNGARLEQINNRDSSGTDLNSTFESTSHLPPSNFVVSVGKLIREQIGNGKVGSGSTLDNEEILFLLLKFNKMFSVNLIKDEFFYKINRSLELDPSTSQSFIHIGKQGINLVLVYKKMIFNFFQDQITKNRIELLDFLVFEGFDFFIRMIVSIFSLNSEQILSLEGDELNQFLNDDEKFFEVINGRTDISMGEYLESVLKFEPNLIKFENEYHLLHANSLNNNNNELVNLKEINDELLTKIRDVKVQLENLKQTHDEIIQQSSSYKDQLKVASDERDQLTKLRDHLKQKYENLSMKENVRNARKANEDFLKRSAELEVQIEQLKLSNEEKRGKIAKISEQKK